MKAIGITLAALALCIGTGGCVSSAYGPMEPTGISNQVRSEIRRLAVRGPAAPRVSLTSDLYGKGAATGNSAKAAGLTWIGGTMEAAGDAGEAAPLVLAVGLLITPVAIVGGALYGAAASDSKTAIAEGNQTLTSVLDFAPARFRRALEQQFAAGVPIDYEFTDDLGDAELAARGFDAVLDIQMDSVASAPSEDRMHAYFTHVNRTELRVFGRPDLTQARSYDARLPTRAVSTWADHGGRQLLSDLDASLAETAGDIVDDFFLKKAIRVQGLEPVSSGWSVGAISGTLPMFVWTALDGGNRMPGPDVEYELRIFTGNQPQDPGIRTKAMRYVPDEPLAACKRHHWQVRAHYQSFGEPTESDWSPTYRFKTPCRK